MDNLERPKSIRRSTERKKTLLATTAAAATMNGSTIGRTELEVAAGTVITKSIESTERIALPEAAVDVANLQGSATTMNAVANEITMNAGAVEITVTAAATTNTDIVRAAKANAEMSIPSVATAAEATVVAITTTTTIPRAIAVGLEAGTTGATESRPEIIAARPLAGNTPMRKSPKGRPCSVRNCPSLRRIQLTTALITARFMYCNISV